MNKPPSLYDPRRRAAPPKGQKWEIFDSRTGRKVTVTTYPSREWARWQIQAWRELGTGNMHHIKSMLHFLDTRPARRTDDR